MSKTASLFARFGIGIALLAPMAAHALELGHLDVQSALGQKLKADIPLEFNTAPDLKRVQIGLASQDEFAGAGLPWTSMLRHIRLHAVKRNGAYFVELSSDRAITQPYLQFLLRIDWPGGQLLREYTALLDPPYLLKQETTVAAPTVSTQTMAAAAPPVRLPQPAPAAAPAAPLAAPVLPPPLLGPPNVKPLPVKATALAKSAVSPVAPPQKVGPLGKGASLWSVAQHLKAREQAGVPQIAFALYRANRTDFVRDNMNGLKRGAVLKVPSDAAVRSVSRSEAVHALEVQSVAWNAFKRQMARHPLTVASGTQPSGSATGPIEASGAGTHAPRRLLKIVGAGAAGSLPTGSARSVLRHDTGSLQEALASSQLENNHLQKRLQKLRQQLDATKRLLAIENKELAQLQVQFKAGHVASATTGVHKPSVQPTTAPAVPVPAKPAPHPAPIVRKPLAAPQVSSPPKTSLVDEIMASPLFVPAAGAVALLLLGLALYIRRRRQSIAEFEESILSGHISDTDPSGAEDSGKQNDASFLSDFSQGGMGNIHTDEVDPIAEAEVYLAYGRDEQAEEILKEAIQKDSMRHELRLRLLEIYHQRKDVRAFETMAEELYAALEGKGGRIWSRAEDLGRKLNPENPLFRQAAPSDSAGIDAETVPASALDRDTAVIESPPVSTEAMSPPPAGSDNPEDSFSFSLDMPPSMSADIASEREAVAQSDAQIPGNELPAHRFEASAQDGPGDLTHAEGGASGREGPATVEFDLELTPLSLSDNEPISGDTLKDLGVFPATQGENLDWALETAETGEAESEAINDGISGSGNGSGEADTKLDLAKAYIDMGDADGARDILKEVLAEGDDHQKEEARRLESTLA
ncbi:MAG: FimV/HubP family polar landmark protein [Acidiferrobacteraceae bacterium]